MTNNYDFNITDAEVADAIAKINEGRAVLAKYLVASLTPEERQQLFKMGPDSKAYMEKLLNYAQDPALLSETINLPAWTNDVAATSQLMRVFNVLEPFYFDVLDMMTLIGNEAMTEGQVNYRYIRYKAQEGQPKARGAYEDLKNERWNRPGKKK